MKIQFSSKDGNGAELFTKLTKLYVLQNILLFTGHAGARLPIDPNSITLLQFAYSSLIFFRLMSDVIVKCLISTKKQKSSKEFGK